MIFCVVLDLQYDPFDSIKSCCFTASPTGLRTIRMTWYDNSVQYDVVLLVLLLVVPPPLLTEASVTFIFKETFF